MLQLIPSETTEKVSPRDIMDYETFNRKHQIRSGGSELKQFERFHASRRLISQEMDSYLNAQIGSEDLSDLFTADVCGLKDKSLTAVFCQTGDLNPPAESIATINRSRNGNAIVILPREMDRHSVDQQLREAVDSGKATMEVLGWFNDDFEATFRETLRLIDLLGNETRMRMLAPLLEKSGAKKDYRARINPKLVYHNISALSDAGLLDENSEGTYDLSQLGKTVLAEFITFLEKTRKALDDSRIREVNND